MHDFSSTLDAGSRKFPAASTDNYLYSQLIPYIGNKRNLLGLICRAIGMTGITSGTFVDLFAGSGVVARLAKLLGFAVIANDWEPYSEAINRCWIECNSAPGFAGLGGINRAFALLNSLPPVEGYISEHLCPLDDENPDLETERMFFTHCNGSRIDAIRQQIQQWEELGLINTSEKAVLLAPLIYSVSYTSNTSGVFKGFHRGWGGATKTAHYRILSLLNLRQPIFHDNLLSNAVHCTDSLSLALSLRDQKQQVDIAYIDPPYNQHPYGSNYHVLNTVTLWDKPEVSPHITDKNKSAIRKDWRTSRRSAYHRKQEAVQEYGLLLQALDAKFILTSYSTDGVMPVRNLLECAGEHGRMQVLIRPYKRYRVSTQRMSTKPVNVEFVLVVDTSSRALPGQTDKIYDQIMQTEHQALAEHLVRP